MDKRLISIFELVFLLNQKGKDMQIELSENSVYILDTKCRNIVPHWAQCIYLDKHWESDYDDMVNGTLEILETMLEENK